MSNMERSIGVISVGADSLEHPAVKIGTQQDMQSLLARISHYHYTITVI